jgi:hypothetical protein
METALNRKYILACSLMKNSVDVAARTVANSVLIDMGLPGVTIDEVVSIFERSPNDALTPHERRLRDFARSIDLTNPPEKVG